MRVLIVDDERPVAELLELAFTQAGHLAVVRYDGLAVEAYLAVAPCDGVLLDVMMHPLSGLEVLRRVHARWPALPVWLMSAHFGEDLAAVAQALGARGYLAKPFRHPDDVVAAVTGQGVTP